MNEAGEAYAVRKRHLDYYMALLDLLGRRERAEYAQLLRRGVTEFDNLRAAFAQSAQVDSDPDLLTRAARGAAWLLDLPLADRLAEAAVIAGGGVEANIVRAHVLSFLSRGEEADAVLADAHTHELTDIDRSRIAFARAMNKFFTLEDPAGAKRLIDDAADTTPPQGRQCIDAFLAVYWAAMGKPEMVKQIIKDLDWEKLPDAGAARASCMGDRRCPCRLRRGLRRAGHRRVRIPDTRARLLRHHRRPPRSAAAGRPGQRRFAHRTKRATGGRAISRAHSSTPSSRPSRPERQ